MAIEGAALDGRVIASMTLQAGTECDEQVRTETTLCPNRDASAVARTWSGSAARFVVWAAAIFFGVFAVLSLLRESSANVETADTGSIGTSDKPGIGEPVRIGHPFWGCRSSDDYGDIIRLGVFEKDVIAANRYARNRCSVLHKDEILVLTDLRVFSGLACVRRSGEADCLWTGIEFVVKK